VKILYTYFIGLALGTGILVLGIQSKPAIPEKLSEYGFFKGDIKQLQAQDGVLPYELNSSLFSDYAQKARFIRLPKDAKIDYQTDKVLDFPVGTVLIKNFYYPNEEKDLTKGRRIIETRLLIHESEGWKAYPYVWNEAQTDANLEITGASIPVQFKNQKNQLVQFTYEVPNINQCKGCHEVSGKMSPIGPSVRQLNKIYPYSSEEKNQLLKLKELGHLNMSETDFAQAPHLVDYQNEKELISERAKAYLDINCAHCHQPNGPAKNSGLNLSWNNENKSTYGLMKSPVAAGRGSGNFQYDILPGKPKESILYFRMNSKDPGIMMPELGRTMVHKEGVELIRRWIEEMK
jgi:uncharacterized repeat protein (TIGR03806 family)